MKAARSIAAGAVAGGAGVTALNAVTYLDMALRGRPSSSTPQQTVERISETSQIPIPGDGGQRENRLDGLGSLAGIATGVVVGALMGLAGPARQRFRFVPTSLAAGAAAMLGADLPMAALGVSDPKKWSATDWLSDAVPHAAYGMAVAWTLGQLERNTSGR